MRLLTILWLLLPAALPGQICWVFTSASPAATFTVRVPTLPAPIQTPTELGGLTYAVRVTGGATHELTAGGQTLSTASPNFTISTTRVGGSVLITSGGFTASNAVIGISVEVPAGRMPANLTLPAELPPFNTWGTIKSFGVAAGGATYPITSYSNCSLGGGGGGGGGGTPASVEVTVDSTPRGLQVTYNDETFATPRTIQWPTGTARRLSAASPQVLDERAYTFTNWTVDNAPPSTQAQLELRPERATRVMLNFGVSNAPAVTGVINAAGGNGLAPATWASVLGVNLATTTRLWTGEDFRGDELPLVLDSVRVAVNGRAAPVYYVSPRQINFLMPSDSATGPTTVRVTNGLGASNEFAITRQATAPSLFRYSPAGGRYAIALAADTFAYLGPSGLLGSAVTMEPAAPGQIITLYATGLGATTPASDPARVVSAPLPLASAPVVTVGGVAAAIQYAGLTGSGLYQLNITVPNVPDGEPEIVITSAGQRSPAGVLLPVRRR